MGTGNLLCCLKTIHSKPVICLPSFMNGQLDCMLYVQQQGTTDLSTAGLPETKPQAIEGVSSIPSVLLHTGKKKSSTKITAQRPFIRI